jgi:hypothetical protein
MNSKKSAECKRGDHKDCDGYIPREFDEKHDRQCQCECHGSTREREFVSEHRPGGLRKLQGNDLKEIQISFAIASHRISDVRDGGCDCGNSGASMRYWRNIRGPSPD